MSFLNKIVGTANDILTGGASSEARKQGQHAVDAWGNIIPPEYQALDPEMFKYLGDIAAAQVASGPNTQARELDPRLAEIAQLDKTSFEDLSIDPRLKEQQMASLAALDEIIQGGGMSLADKAAMEKIQSEVGQADRGRRGAIQQSMAQRGMGGSGMELLQMLDSSQAATDRTSQAGLDQAAMAQQRALDAIMQSGQLSGAMRGQEFGEQSTIADARDAIAQFNAQNRQQGSQFNTNTQNQAQQFNAAQDLANQQYNKDAAMQAQQYNASAQNQTNQFNAQNAQAMANLNTDLRNQTERTNKLDMPTQTFNNQAAIASGKSGAHSASQNAFMQDGQGTKQMLGQAGMAAAMAFSDKKTKKGIESIDDSDVLEFLEAVKPKKYKYKKPEESKAKPGQRIGFLAQDVKDTKLGQDLIQEDEDGTLMYDKDNLEGILLAALSMVAKGKK
jgi:hypothetical protein